MQKRVVLGFLVAVLVVFSVSGVVANGLDDEIKKITHYAEEYETGNIDYVQLMVYTSAVRESINELMGG